MQDNLFKSYKKSEQANEAASENKSSRGKLRYKILIILITTFICGFFFTFHWDKEVYETRLYNLVPGYNWTDRSVYAKFAFSVYKDKDDYEYQVNAAKTRALQVFIAREIPRGRLGAAMDSLKSVLSQESVAGENKAGKRSTSESFELIAANRLNKISGMVTKILEKVEKKGFVNVSLENIKNPEISVRTGDTHFEKIITKADLVDTNKFIERASNYFREGLNNLDAEIALNIAKQLMMPNILYSAELTERSREVAGMSVPRTIGIVRQGDLIIGKGQRLTSETVEKLKSYERAQMNAGDSKYTWLTVLGSFGHAFLIYSLLISYLFFMRKRIYRDNVQFGLASLILLGSSFFSWLSLQLQISLPVEYLVMIPAMSALSAIIFDSRTAFYMTVTMTFMFAGIRGNDFDAGTAMLLAGTLAAYSVKDFQGRTQIFRSTIVIFIGFLVPIMFFGIERSGEAQQFLLKLVAIIVNSAVSPLITFALLFLIERFTNITTNMRLQEFDNQHHPLLVKLNEIAPGTYQHTLSVAILAEKCASAIGANDLLAKVGTYFHDIGKIAKPEYFVENQQDMENKHDLIPAKKSAAIIRGHVTEGMKIAKEYKLPERISDFVSQHHGTTLIKHFYAKALEEAEDKTLVRESDFRYAGPKPQTKECAVLMICDSAEAMSRVAAGDKAKLEMMMDSMIKDRILDGQFDECNLTFKDITLIKQVCVRNLLAGAHKRIEYKRVEK